MNRKLFWVLTIALGAVTLALGGLSAANLSAVGLKLAETKDLEHQVESIEKRIEIRISEASEYGFDIPRG